ncbi:Inner kinetochore subunit CHL4 [Colletotrichum trifolii]|uniref:Inner kinetochore subunit CHL4 n=1 Tax=Colletotrichum trifolii TaxID=5466 RepID=A0A4V3HTY3_COLTR|nr:Inner kinetochore subunit CHL4 [Colletotrichum trifolii]
MAVEKSLNRLSRSSLLKLALEWISDDNFSLCGPLLGNDDDDVVYQPAASLQELRALYADLQNKKGSKREILERITEGDWQHGLTLYQLAMADAQYLQDHPTSQKWTAYQILPLKDATYIDDEEQPPEIDKESLKLPRFHPSTFIQNLQSYVLPDVKAHYHIHRPQDLAMTVLRIFIIESPYSTSVPNLGRISTPAGSDGDGSRTLYIALPDGSPYVYLSKSQTIGSVGAAESKSFRNLVAEGIPKAFSRPRERYVLKPTNIWSKNIAALLYTKGAGRTNAAGGGWSTYADKKNESPLDTVLPTPPLSDESDDSSGVAGFQPPKRRAEPLGGAGTFLKRAKLCARARFGETANFADGLGIERVDIAMEDPFPSDTLGEANDREEEAQDGQGRQGELAGSVWVPDVKLIIHGSHVFAGTRQLVEHGIINGERMPGWLTGEEGVSLGAVRHGRIRGHKGSGL